MSSEPRNEPPPRRSSPQAEPPASLPEIGGQALHIGDKLNDYTVQRLIGSGGMAHILLAEHPERGLVALKILKQNRVETGISRFRREYRALSKIDHPNVIHVYEFGDLRGHPYIAMEYVDCTDLYGEIKALRQMPAPQRWARCEEILVQLCRALAAIHRQGLVHRDLKPSNILLTSDGTVKITDFGIVKDLAPDGTPELSSTLAGTWAYASPEHISGRTVDHRADLYSLGVLLYTMLTGKRPFVAEGMAGYLQAHRDLPAPRVSDSQPDVPPELDAICAKLLEKLPRNRFQSAVEVLHRLQRPDDAETELAPPWLAPLVDQEDVRAELDLAFSGLSANKLAFVRIEGPDGSGRSRMLAEAQKRARELGFWLDTWSCEASVDPLSALRGLVASLNHATPTPTASRQSIADEGFALLDQFTGLVAQRLSERPLVLTIDDAHQMSATAFELLQIFAYRIQQREQRALAVIVAARPSAFTSAPTPSAPWHTAPVALRPLSLSGVHTIVASLIGTSYLTGLLARRIFHDTGGHPLAVVELTHALLSQRLLTAGPDGYRPTTSRDDLIEGHIEIPPVLRNRFQVRKHALSPTSHAMFAMLSLAKTDLDLDAFALAFDLSESGLLQAMSALIDCAFARTSGTRDHPTYQIASPMLSKLLRESLRPADLREASLTLAHVFQNMPLQSQEVQLITGEYLASAGQLDQAYLSLVRVAFQLAHEGRFDLLPRAISRATQLHATPRESIDPEVALTTSLQLDVASAVLLANKGAYAQAELTLEACATRAKQAGKDSLLALVQLERCGIWTTTGKLAEAGELGESLLSDARKAHDRAMIALSLYSLSVTARAMGDLDRSEHLADEGVVACLEPSLRAQRMLLFLVRAVAQGARGQLNAAERGIRDALALLDPGVATTSLSYAKAALAAILSLQGTTWQAWQEADHAVSVAESLQSRIAIAIAYRARGLANLELGHATQAALDLKRGEDAAQIVQINEQRIVIAALQAKLALEQSDPATAHTFAASALHLIDTNRQDPDRYTPMLQAICAHALGRSRPALTGLLLQQVEDALPTLPTPRQLQTQLVLARTWHAVGDHGRALGTVEAVLRHPDLHLFRTTALEAYALGAEWANQANAARFLATGREMLQTWTASMPPEQARHARARQVFRALREPVILPPATGRTDLHP